MKRSMQWMAILAIAIAGIGASLGYPGLESVAPEGKTCPYADAGDAAPERAHPETADGNQARICPYSGATLEDASKRVPDAHSENSNPRAKCPFSGQSTEKDAKQPRLGPIDPRQALTRV